MNADIADAVRTKRRLRFRYHGRTRLVEPQCHGIGTKGTELLRAHQLEGGSPREPLFDVERMVDERVADAVAALDTDALSPDGVGELIRTVDSLARRRR